VESTTTKKEELAKVIANLQARLKESESKLKEFELKVSKEREAKKELEEELLAFKKEAVE